MFAGYSANQNHIHSRSDTIKIIFYFLGLSSVILLLFSVSYLYNNHPIYLMYGTITFMVLYLMKLALSNQESKWNSYARKTFIVLFIIFLMITISYGIYLLFRKYTTYSLLVVAALFLVAVYYGSKFGYSKLNISNIINNIEQFIYDFKEDYTRTDTKSKMLIIFQIVIIVLFFVYHIIYNSISQLMLPRGTYLMQTTEQLNKTKLVATYDELKNSFDRGSEHDYHYGMSMWVYIDSETNIDDFVNIFSYGKNPSIEFSPSQKVLRLQVKANKKLNCSDSSYKTIYSTDKLQYQKWNHFVVNYKNSKLDLFVNNELVHSESDVLPYMSEDTIVIGNNTSVSGKIKNIVYFKTPLSMSSIQKIYYNENNRFEEPLLLANSNFYKSFTNHSKKLAKDSSESIENTI